MKLEEVKQLILEHRALGDAAKKVDAPRFWPDVFQKFFVETTDVHADDLVILVKKAAGAAGSSNGGGGGGGSDGGNQQLDMLDVFRRGSPTRPMPQVHGNTLYNWEESTCLNLLLQQVTYMLTCAVCSRDPQSKKLRVIHKLTNQVYASPSKRSMESKSADEIITFPMLYFSIDDFDQRFEDVVVAPEECVCVELVATCGGIRSTIFSGAVTHSQLAASFSSKTSRQWTKSKKSGKGKKMEFLHMLGPKGLGHAEMAVSISTNDGGGSSGNSSDGSSSSSSSSGDSAADKTVGGALKNFGRAAFSLVKDIASGGPDAASCGLNAYLTFVSLSWETMIENVVEKIQPPALDKEKKKSSASAAAGGGGQAGAATSTDTANKN